jgi:hypothetical protein
MAKRIQVPIATPDSADIPNIPDTKEKDILAAVRIVAVARM